MNREKIPGVVTSIIIYLSTSAVVGFIGYQLGLGLTMDGRHAALLGLAAVAMYMLLFWASEAVWLSLDMKNLRGDVHPLIPFPLVMLGSLLVVFVGAMLVRELNRGYELLINHFGARGAKRIAIGAGVLFGVSLAAFLLFGLIEELRKSK